MSEWQPIETAPSNIPIMVTDGTFIVVIEKTKLAGEFWAEGYGFSGYEWGWYFEYEDLTHWMPLPEMPK